MILNSSPEYKFNRCMAHVPNWSYLNSFFEYDIFLKHSNIFKSYYVLIHFSTLLKITYTITFKFNTKIFKGQTWFQHTEALVHVYHCVLECIALFSSHQAVKHNCDIVLYALMLWSISYLVLILWMEAPLVPKEVCE